MSKPKWLRDVAARQKKNPPTSIRYHLHKHLSGMRPGRPLTTIHASDVVDKEDWCPRRAALLLREGMPPPSEMLFTSQSVVFQQSSDVANRICLWLADIGLARGRWVCSVCRETDVPYGPRPEVCEKCNYSRFSYRELRVTSSDSGISGGLDVVVHFPGKEKTNLVELKGLQKKDFVDLKMALATHKTRTNLYLRLVDEDDEVRTGAGERLRDLVDTEEAIILYAVKGGYGIKSDDALHWGLPDQPWTPFKEFVVKRNDEDTQEYADRSRPLKLWMEDFEKGIGNPPLPPGICDTSACSVAVRCPVRGPCWS